VQSSLRKNRALGKESIRGILDRHHHCPVVALPHRNSVVARLHSPRRNSLDQKEDKFWGQKDTAPFAVAIFIFRPRLKESVRESRARGGRKAAANMNAEARKLRARNAAAARWLRKE